MIKICVTISSKWEGKNWVLQAKLRQTREERKEVEGQDSHSFSSPFPASQPRCPNSYNINSVNTQFNGRDLRKFDEKKSLLFLNGFEFCGYCSGFIG
jgi:hypothetical protein